MKALAVALPLTLAAGVFIGVHSETPWFGPRVADLVSIGGTTPPIASGSTVVLATVPATEHLVLSAITVTSVAVNPNGTHAEWGFSILQRDPTGAIVVKCPKAVFSGPPSNVANHVFGTLPLPAINGVGVVFDPGTDVLLKYVDPSNTGSYPTAIAEYLLVGHQASR